MLTNTHYCTGTTLSSLVAFSQSEYKKARADIKKKSSDTIKLQKKVKKGKRSPSFHIQKVFISAEQQNIQQSVLLSFKKNVNNNIV